VSQCAPRRKGADTLVRGTGGSKLRASQCSSFLATTHAATCGSIHWYGCAGSRSSAAVLVVYFGFDFDLPIWSCLGMMKTRYRPTACVESTSSAFVNCADATCRKPRAGSIYTGARCSGFWQSVRRS